MFVTAIDVFVGLGWLPASAEWAWRQGRVPYLEAAVHANLNKISKAMRFLRRWAQRRRLKPSETAYLRRVPGRPALRFSKSGNPSIERAYLHALGLAQLSQRKRRQLAGAAVHLPARCEDRRLAVPFAVFAAAWRSCQSSACRSAR